MSLETNGEPSVPTGSNQAIVNTMIMPWFMGVPWVRKFSGEGSETKFGEWLWQIEAMLRAQRLSEEQKVDFIVGAFRGQCQKEKYYSRIWCDKNQPCCSLKHAERLGHWRGSILGKSRSGPLEKQVQHKQTKNRVK